MTTLHEAAAHLQRSIVAPPGAVNTLAFVDDQGPIIRVFVEPALWERVNAVPEVFEGYRVSLEMKGKSELF